MLKIIIGVVVVLGVIMLLVDKGGQLGTSFAMITKGSGTLGKIILSLIIIAVGCMVISFITGMPIMVDLAKGCIALAVVLVIGRIIKSIFKN